jgi:hypothetical protein
VVVERLLGHVRGGLLDDETYGALVGEIAERRLDPYSAAERVLARLEASR